jgi:nitroreductase
VNADDLAELIASRRSNISIDPSSDVKPEHIAQLLTAAQNAPNHKRTWPLRVAVLRGDSRRDLGEKIADAMAQRGDDAPKVEKTRTKYLRSPIIIVVASAIGASDSETEENKYAVAAGIQNLLLTAEVLKYAALWSTPAKGANDAITTVCGFEPTDHVMGIIYVGVAAKPAPAVERPALRVTYLN